MEVAVGGKSYRTGKLDCRTQFHISRRLMPLMVARLDGLRSLAVVLGVPGAVAAARDAELSRKADQKADEVAQSRDAEIEDSVLIASFMPVANALAKMPEADVNYVIDTCLAVCTRVEPGGLAPVMVEGRIMYSDLDMAGMMQLVNAVVKENCGNFFPEPPVSAKSS